MTSDILLIKIIQMLIQVQF